MRNGGYDRWFWDDGTDVRRRVYRKFCRKHTASFALLPMLVLARWQYPLPFVVAWLWAALHGASCRSREFLIAQGVRVAEPEPEMSWSDQQEEGHVRPCYQLLARWSREFAIRAARLIPALMSLCVLLGVEMKAVAESVSALRVTRSRLSPLPVALGLMLVLRRALTPQAEIDLETCLSDLVIGLTRRRLPPSHGVLRASGGRLLYDSLIT